MPAALHPPPIHLLKFTLHLLQQQSTGCAVFLGHRKHPQIHALSLKLSHLLLRVLFEVHQPRSLRVSLVANVDLCNLTESGEVGCKLLLRNRIRRQVRNMHCVVGCCDVARLDLLACKQLPSPVVHKESEKRKHGEKVEQRVHQQGATPAEVSNSRNSNQIAREANLLSGGEDDGSLQIEKQQGQREESHESKRDRSVVGKVQVQPNSSPQCAQMRNASVDRIQRAVWLPRHRLHRKTLRELVVELRWCIACG
mmetsp:Transcript_25634/g.50022  ORF Transcript_25634/g.50022 Transcript_25634/m.50022 type:complete len:253 (-) Transcript_25634:161-919(-)